MLALGAVACCLAAERADACSRLWDPEPIKVVPASGARIPPLPRLWVFLEPDGLCGSQDCDLADAPDRLTFELRPDAPGPAIALRGHVLPASEGTVVELVPVRPLPPGIYDLALVPTGPRFGYRHPSRLLGSYLVAAESRPGPPACEPATGDGVYHKCPHRPAFGGDCGSGPPWIVFPKGNGLAGPGVLALWIGADAAPDTARAPDLILRGSEKPAVTLAAVDSVLGGHAGVRSLVAVARAVDLEGRMGAPATWRVDLTRPICGGW